MTGYLICRFSFASFTYLVESREADWILGTERAGRVKEGAIRRSYIFKNKGRGAQAGPLKLYT